LAALIRIENVRLTDTAQPIWVRTISP
jgi:hypothetical protein